MTKHSRSSGKKVPGSTSLYRKTASSLLLITLLLAGFAASVQAQPATGVTPRIVGGTTAKASEYPWAAALLRTNINNGFDAQFCGGTLVASRWVLTAAHCVNDLLSAGDVEVAIGINNLNDISRTDRTAIDNIFIHPGYNTVSQDNDIALLRLAKPSNNVVLAIADNTLTNNIAVGELMTVIGWGTTSANPLTPSFPNLLQETQIPLSGFDACNTIYDDSLTSNMICAGFAAGGQDTCQGDSGGPMLYFNTSDSTYYQTGVTSFGNGCAQAGNPGIYTRAANYRNWVDTTTSITLSGQYQFGYHGVDRGTSTTLTLHNYSGADITVSAVNLGNPANFTLLSQNCTGPTIANNGNCSITVQFRATRAGTHQSTLSVDFGTGNPSLNTTISGIGLATISATGLDESPARLWYSGGSASWFNTVTSNSNGGTAMRSGYIGDNQNTALLAYFTGPDTLDFRWKVSTEQDYDFLKLYVDGELIDAISGDQDWQQRNIPLGKGEHRVVWVYEKDSSFSRLQDTAWLDSINTSFVNTSSGGGLGSGGGGKPDTLFLLLLAVILILRKGFQHHRTISPGNR